MTGAARPAALALLLLAAASPLLAGRRDPRIVFDKKEHDFGPLMQGATVQASFSFKNGGKGVLEILSVDSSCGCTAALASEKSVKPGRTGRIDVVYDSHGKVGEVGKVVRVRSNDPKEPMVHLALTGLVIPSAHPDRTGAKTLFEGACRACHADRGAGKAGKALYDADCALCHEHHKIGGKFIAPAADAMSALSPEGLRRRIAQGLPGTSMPAYHQDKGGPLTDEQVESLVAYLKSLMK